MSFQKNEGDPKTPLNSLDPKFCDNHRHITNIGLNLTDDQPNSPKRTNIQQNSTSTLKQAGKQSASSSPTDSEGESTDEEWNEPKASDRKTRPSDSSMENEIAITSDQSYMRIPVNNPIPLPPKRISLVLDKKQESSDTEENASPIIGPKDQSSCVEINYDFPRSYHEQKISASQREIAMCGSMPSIHGHLVTSTPNLIHSGTATLDRNFYGNAKPGEPHVFRFDSESISMPPPVVNRTLKPKKNGYGEIKSPQAAPVVDRKLKPTAMSKVRELN